MGHHQKVEGTTFRAALVTATLACAVCGQVGKRKGSASCRHAADSSLGACCPCATMAPSTEDRQAEGLGASYSSSCTLHALRSHHPVDQACFTQCLLHLQHLCQNLQGRDGGNEGSLKAPPLLGIGGVAIRLKEQGGTMQNHSKHLFFKLLYLRGTACTRSASWSVSSRDIQLHHLQLCHLLPAPVGKDRLVLEMWCDLQKQQEQHPGW